MIRTWSLLLRNAQRQGYMISGRVDPQQLQESPYLMHPVEAGVHTWIPCSSLSQTPFTNTDLLDSGLRGLHVVQAPLACTARLCASSTLLACAVCSASAVRFV